MLVINNNAISCDGLLLDFDDTLVASGQMIVNLWIDLCKERDGELDSNSIKELVRGRPGTKIVADLFPSLDESERHTILQELERKEEVAPYQLMKGANEFIHAAVQAGITLGIVTSSWNEKVWHLLNRFDIGHLFSVIVTRDDVSKLKPDPQPYLVAEGRMGIHRGNLVAVEDSRSGIVSAKSAGINCVGFGQENLKEFGADCVVFAFEHMRVET